MHQTKPPWRINEFMLRVRGSLGALSAIVQTLYLAARNRVSSQSLTGDAGVVLSMTSYGHRISSVHIAIESIARGACKPSRAILWLDEESQLESLPPTLKRLERRGLEILATENYGPHKKLYSFAISKSKHDGPVVTCDDDVIYPRNWLRELLLGFYSAPNFVTGMRARRILLDGDALAPYESWPVCTSRDPSFLHMLTNVSGNIYPPEFVDRVRDAGADFMKVAPTADDLWLHHVALRHNFRTRQVAEDHLQLRVVPGSQKSSLTAINVSGGQNDQIVRNLYRSADVVKLRDESTG